MKIHFWILIFCLFAFLCCFVLAAVSCNTFAVSGWCCALIFCYCGLLTILDNNDDDKKNKK